MLALFAALAIAACGDESSEGAQAQSPKPMTGLTLTREFKELFPKATNSVSHRPGQEDEQKGVWKIGLHERYVLSLELDLDFGGASPNPSRLAREPEFVLREIARVELSPAGGARIIPGEFETRFGLEDWKNLRESGGDFAAIGITLDEDRPLENFSRAWE